MAKSFLALLVKVILTISAIALFTFLAIELTQRDHDGIMEIFQPEGRK